ncbi:MAG: hypothetical protein RIC30_02495 [Marinoscillum sp.]|uniref:hypothetical protein n=1 Tax=Marinoscillum sp. TaxID=2024838 RepID=UPI0032FB9E3E
MENYSAPNALKTTKIIHTALMTGCLLFGVVVLVLNAQAPTGSTRDQEFLLYLPAVFLVFSAVVSSVLFKKTLKQGLAHSADLQQKMAAFQTANIVRMAFYEASGLIAVVVCFLTGDLYNMLILLVVVLVFLMKMPTPHRIAKEVGLSDAEQAELSGLKD